MPTTGSPGNIWYPDSTAPVAPLENLFLQLATSVNVALGAGLPQAPADLAALSALSAASTGLIAVVQEGGAIFEANGSIWVQRTPAMFASASARDTAYAKASAAYLVQGAQVRRSDNNWVEEYSTIYNSSTNLAGRTTAGWYPVTIDIQRHYYQALSGNATNGVTIPTGGTFVVKRRPYKQRVRITYFGNIANASGATAGGLGVAASTGGTVVLAGGPQIIIQNSGTAYGWSAVVEIASGIGTDVTITFSTVTGAGTVAFSGSVFMDLDVEGEW